MFLRRSTFSCFDKATSKGLNVCVCVCVCVCAVATVREAGGHLPCLLSRCYCCASTSHSHDQGMCIDPPRESHELRSPVSPPLIHPDLHQPLIPPSISISIPPRSLSCQAPSWTLPCFPCRIERQTSKTSALLLTQGPLPGICLCEPSMQQKVPYF